MKVPFRKIWFIKYIGIEFSRKGDSVIYVYPWRRKQYGMGNNKYHSIGFCAYFPTLKALDDEWDSYARAMGMKYGDPCNK
jgi:hypothetical protein